MNIKSAFIEGCCIGHYSGKKKECAKICKIRKVCKSASNKKNREAITSIMKMTEKQVKKSIDLVES